MDFSNRLSVIISILIIKYFYDSILVFKKKKEPVGCFRFFFYNSNISIIRLINLL
jgi:hypothetical protein